jgi:superfamily II DNA/RNA helicase
LRAFRNGKVDVLVATDVAARGIDVEGVTHVVNVACPEDEKTYLHRIGRTGRAGASGIAVTLVDWEDVARWKMINKVLDLPYDEPVETYSSSEHLFHDLGIPPGTTGRLPAQARTRAGLSAEAVEDLGETGRRRNGPRRGAEKGRTRSGDDRRERRARTEHGESGADNRENATSRRPRRSRTRQRSRAGVPVPRTTTSDPSASGPPSST